MFGVVPKSIWHRLQPADEKNLCTWAMRCLLIEDGKRLILIDTGIGSKQDEKFFSHYYLHGDTTLEKSLNQKGFTSADITDVFLTHLHFDHVGGAIVRKDGQLKPAFPNAVYWSNEKHWNHAVYPNAREKASFLRDNIIPIADSGQLQFLKEEYPRSGKEGPVNVTDPGNAGMDAPLLHFTDSISIRMVHGHTESMMLPQIRYGNHTIVYMADLFPSIAHLPIPYVMAYDIHPLKSLTEKELFLQEALANNYTLFFEHDPVHECCQVIETERGIREGEKFRLMEL